MIKTKPIQSCLLLQPPLSLAKEEMYFLSFSSSPTGQDLLFRHHVLRGIVFCSFTSFSYLVVSRNIPTSFSSPFACVLHKLQAELKRRTKLTIRIATVLNFVSKPDVNIPRLMV